ncbi:predicted protein [Botrytis cinerea T4]|uniref:Uncharacterized protein n=1 Tax=Botryotinia fuckeliana (strain T4) TaxID=999810 RepID=G2XWG9_BOTF4|nr:predicted protein [Botrytis cinerea T4]
MICFQVKRSRSLGSQARKVLHTGKFIYHKGIGRLNLHLQGPPDTLNFL